MKWLEEVETYLTDKRHEAELKAEDARVKFLRKEGRKYRSKHRNILKSKEYVFSQSTDTGLKVSLKATVALLKYLTEKCDFQFFMTARLNQDDSDRQLPCDKHREYFSQFRV